MVCEYPCMPIGHADTSFRSPPPDGSPHAKAALSISSRVADRAFTCRISTAVPPDTFRSAAQSNAQRRIARQADPSWFSGKAKPTAGERVGVHHGHDDQQNLARPEDLSQFPAARDNEMH